MATQFEKIAEYLRANATVEFHYTYPPYFPENQEPDTLQRDRYSATVTIPCFTLAGIEYQSRSGMQRGEQSEPLSYYVEGLDPFSPKLRRWPIGSIYNLHRAGENSFSGSNATPSAEKLVRNVVNDLCIAAFNDERAAEARIRAAKENAEREREKAYESLAREQQWLALAGRESLRYEREASAEESKS